MEYNSIIKFGRILLGLGIGTLIGICSSGEQAIEEFGIFIFLGIIAIIVGLSIVFITKNKAKLEELQTTNKDIYIKSCPNCGLSLSNDCKECTKCNTAIE